MRIGLHGQAGRQFNEYLRRYETICAHNGIECIRLDVGDDGFWDDLGRCDAFIFRWGQSHDVDRLIAFSLLPVIEQQLGIPCFPNWATCWHFDNKIAQYYLLRSIGAPCPRSWAFFDLDSALEWTREASYPVVAKLIGGAGSTNVKLIHSRGEAERLVRRLFLRGILPGRFDLADSVSTPSLARTLGGPLKRTLANLFGTGTPPSLWVPHQHYALFQEYLPGNDFDIRIVTIGRRVFGYRRFRRPGDFRASGSGLKDMNHRNIDMDCVRTGLEISTRCGFQAMAYDFFRGRDGAPEILEISYTIPELAVQNLPGYWSSQLEWHEGRWWPQYFHLVDLLNAPDLLQPEISAPIKWDTLPDGELLHPRLVR